MKAMIQIGFALVAAAMLVTSSMAQTKTDAKPDAKTEVKPTAAKPAVKPAAKPAPKPVVDTVFAYPAATGVMPCEDGVTVTIKKDAKRADGYDVMLGKVRYPTTRVNTESGAIRLENKASGIVWLQMSNKSMLLNEKASKRLANNCHSDAQTAVEKTLANTPTPNVLDTPASKKP